MKIMHEQVDIPGGSPLKVKINNSQHFTFPWHYHSQFEIVYVIESTGSYYVGDTIKNFSGGSLVLVGSNVPHFWKSAPEYHSTESKLNVFALIIQFPEGFPRHFGLSYSEFQNIRDLLIRSQRGVCFSSKVSKKLHTDLLNLLEIKGMERILAFIKILEQMARTKEYELITSEAFSLDSTIITSDRLEKVLNYLQLNYQNELSVNDIAQKFSMNTTAFCRFFKEKTSKSIVQFINEMRVGYACKLLMDESIAVSDVCCESGFNNISNFNKVFKKITGTTPSKYRIKIKG